MFLLKHAADLPLTISDHSCFRSLVLGHFFASLSDVKYQDCVRQERTTDISYHPLIRHWEDAARKYIEKKDINAFMFLNLPNAMAPGFSV